MSSRYTIRDRFFLEEIVHRLKNGDLYYAQQLSSDWLQEMVEQIPLGEGERRDFIRKELDWDEDFIKAAYFPTEQDLKNYLYGES